MADSAHDLDALMRETLERCSSLEHHYTVGRRLWQVAWAGIGLPAILLASASATLAAIVGSDQTLVVALTGVSTLLAATSTFLRPEFRVANYGRRIHALRGAQLRGEILVASEPTDAQLIRTWLTEFADLLESPINPVDPGLGNAGR
jgi:hypothetical protein